MGEKMKMYVYPNARPPAHESIPGFENTIPFCAQGRAKHCVPVTDPAHADYFYMGQVADKDAWQLHPNRWPYFEGNEARHIIDLEGDWRDQDHPDWLQDAIITTGHVRLESRAKFKRRFARPVMSPLLMRLVNNPPEYTCPEVRGFWFQGQMDFTKRIREKVHQAAVVARVPGEWTWINGWSLYRGEDDPVVLDYLAKARKWSHALCPIGEGPSARLYEMAMLGRIPVLIGDYEPSLDEHGVFTLRLSPTMSVEEMAAFLKKLLDYDYHWKLARNYANRLRVYFADPTAYLLEWLRGK